MPKAAIPVASIPSLRIVTIGRSLVREATEQASVNPGKRRSSSIRISSSDIMLQLYKLGTWEGETVEIIGNRFQVI